MVGIKLFLTIFMRHFIRYVKIIILMGVLLICSLFYMQGCEEIQGKGNLLSTRSGQFSDYWRQGLAELNRYRLEQVRYGEVHEGDAV